MEIPDLFTPIVGYRAFVKMPNATLSSVAVYQEAAYLPNKVYTATCRAFHSYDAYFGTSSVKHDAPQFDCSCGFYAFKHRKQVLQYVKNGSYSYAIAKVHLWGRVIEHELGYRAQYMKIIWIKPLGKR